MIVDLEGNLISSVPDSHGSFSRLPPIQSEARILFLQMGNLVSGLGMLKTTPASKVAPPAFVDAFEVSPNTLLHSVGALTCRRCAHVTLNVPLIVCTLAPFAVGGFPRSTPQGV